jgi:hypothetical protein
MDEGRDREAAQAPVRAEHRLTLIDYDRRRRPSGFEELMELPHVAHCACGRIFPAASYHAARLLAVEHINEQS